MPDPAVSAYRELCLQILEPVREKIAAPMAITSGYRPPAANTAVHGVKNSQHIATALYCAADFRVEGLKDLRPIFDWLRLESGLPYDQLILEHGAGGDIIHVSWAKAFQRREALEGATHNYTAYTAWPSIEPGRSNA